MNRPALPIRGFTLASKIATGKRGEDQAASFLQGKGYRIIGRNVRARFGEIDLVAWHGKTICFIEVKARSSERFGLPEEAVNFFKRRTLIRLAQWYLQAHPNLRAEAVRFDVVSLVVDGQGKPLRTRLIPNAFQADS